VRSCVFCRIAAGESPASVIYEDAECMAFMDLYPIRSGHLLVMPRRHAVHLRDLSAPEQARLFELAMRVLAALRASGVVPDAANLLVNDGPDSGQHVPHVHIHLVPRARLDAVGFMGAFLSRVVHFARRSGRRSHLDALAARIRTHLPAG
jgi:histidine triad (HIT) family protein